MNLYSGKYRITYLRCKLANSLQIPIILFNYKYLSFHFCNLCSCFRAVFIIHTIFERPGQFGWEKLIQVRFPREATSLTYAMVFFSIVRLLLVSHVPYLFTSCSTDSVLQIIFL